MQTPGHYYKGENYMKLKIVVIGANAAGAKAASKAKRINPKADVILIDKGNFISYGACGIPYYVSDTVADIKELMWGWSLKGR